MLNAIFMDEMSGICFQITLGINGIMDETRIIVKVRRACSTIYIFQIKAYLKLSK